MLPPSPEQAKTLKLLQGRCLHKDLGFLLLAHATNTSSVPALLTPALSTNLPSGAGEGGASNMHGPSAGCPPPLSTMATHLPHPRFHFWVSWLPPFVASLCHSRAYATTSNGISEAPLLAQGSQPSDLSSLSNATALPHSITDCIQKAAVALARISWLFFSCAAHWAESACTSCTEADTRSDC